MIMFIVCDGEFNILPREVELLLETFGKFTVSIQFLGVVVEMLALWLVQFVEGMLAEAVNVYTLFGICLKDLFQNVFGVR